MELIKFSDDSKLDRTYSLQKAATGDSVRAAVQVRDRQTKPNSRNRCEKEEEARYSRERSSLRVKGGPSSSIELEGEEDGGGVEVMVVVVVEEEEDLVRSLSVDLPLVVLLVLVVEVAVVVLLLLLLELLEPLEPDFDLPAIFTHNLVYFLFLFSCLIICMCIYPNSPTRSEA